MIQFLLDEHVSPEYRTQIQRRHSEIVVWSIGDPGAPPHGTPDESILEWCEEHSFVLVTNNRKTMPVHLEAHLHAGRHVPGILILDLDLSVGAILDELALIASASRDDEYEDQIVYLPLT